MVRAYYFGWYEEMLTDLPAYKNGRISAPDKPGLGTSLRSEIPKRHDAIVRWSHHD
jgi:galactonate dehydratase